ncbi:MAG: YcxB family protein [Candidatus Zixiibacteriota bacterium]
MRLVFETSIDDKLAFTKHLLATDRLVKRRINRGRIMYSLFFAILCAFALWQGKTGLGVLYLVFGIGIFFFHPWFYKMMSVRNAKKTLVQRDANWYQETVTMSIENDTLLIKSDLGSTNLLLKAFLKIESSETHTFLFTDVRQALYIPHDRIQSGDKDLFIQTLKSRMSTAA